MNNNSTNSARVSAREALEPAPIYITREEAQRILGCQKSTIYELMRSGQLPFSNVGAKRFVRREDLYQLIERGFNAPSLVAPSGSEE